MDNGVERSADTHSIEDIMAVLQAGDPAALVWLLEGYGDRIARFVRSQARTFNVELSADDVEDLVNDTLLICFDVAPTWRPGGALPWRYAQGRVRQAISSHIGQFSDDIDDEKVAPQAEAVREAQVVAETASWLRIDLDSPDHDVDAIVALFLEGCDQVMSRKRRDILIAHGNETAAGNDSPAVTVATMFDKSEDAVRQAVSRAKSALRQLAAATERFAPLLDLPLLRGERKTPCPT